MVPNTALMTAPMGTANPFGEAMHHRDLLRGLRQANPRLNAPEPTFSDRATTALWLGPPFQPGSKKITALDYGIVPEFTIVDARNGTIACKGWRAILYKVIRSRAARMSDLERIFKTTLGTSSKRDGLCPRCRKGGLKVKANGGKHGLCDDHDSAYSDAIRAQQVRRALK